MTNREMPQLSEEFNQKLIKLLSEFFQEEESIPKELFPAIQIDIKLNLSKLPPTTDRQVSLLIGEQRISSSAINQTILLKRVACSPCGNPDPNDICSAWGNYCSDT